MKGKIKMTDKKILVIEDDKDVARGLTIRLRANGYSVVSASDAVCAISVARKEEPDLILLDLGLPAGDGFIVMERLRNLTQTAITPIIVITARDPKINREKALSAGAYAFLQKPVDNDELLSTIQESLAGKAPCQLS